MKNDPSPISNIPGLPPRKWYEQEVTREIFLPFPFLTVQEQILKTLSAGEIREKNFWSRPTTYAGILSGNRLDLEIGIPGGKGTRFEYHVFGEITAYSNGCAVRMVIRDTNRAVLFLLVAVFVVFLFLIHGVGGRHTGHFLFWRFCFFGLLSSALHGRGRR